MALLLALASMSASAPWSRVSAAPSWSGSTGGWPRMSMSTPPTTRRRPRSRRGCASVPRSRRSCPAAAPIRNWRARRSRCWACPITPPIATTGRCCSRRTMPGIKLRPGDAALVSEQLARRLKLSLGDRIEVPAPGGNWPLDVVGIYADYGNPKGQIAVNFAALTRRFPEIPLTRMGLRVAPAEDTGADLGAAGKIRARRPQRRRSGDDEGGIDADLQPHLCGDRGAERLHARRRRHRAVDQPADAGQFPAAATGAAMGDRHHAAAAGGHRTSEDDVGGADHRAASRCRSACWWRGACSRSSTSRRSAGGCRFTSSRCNCCGCSASRWRRRLRRRAARHQAGAHAAGEPDQDFCQ